MSDFFDRWSKRPALGSQSSGSIFDRWSTGQGGLTPSVGEEREGGGVLDTVLDVLATPGRMTAGAVSAIQDNEPVFERMLANRPTALGGTREDDFDDVLAAAGMEDTWGRRGLGLALDVVVDPLNAVPVAPAVKGVAKLASPVTKAVGETRVAKELAEKFVPYAGLDKFKANVVQSTPGAPAGGRQTVQELSYQDLRRLHQSGLEATRDAAGRDALDLFREAKPREGVLSFLGPKYEHLTSDEAFEIAKALDEGRPLMDPRLDKMRAAAAKRFDQQFAKEVAAGVMPPDARRVDYVTHIMTDQAKRDPVNARALSAKNPFQHRKELSLAEGVEAGVFEPDIRKIMSERLAIGDRAIENQKFFQQTAKLFGKKVKKGQKPPPGYVRPQLAGDPSLKKALKGVYVPAEIARDLEKVIELPKQSTAIGHLFNEATALWKGYATRANPGFHTRNAVSNMMQSWFAGVGDTGTKLLDPIVVASKHVDAFRKVQDPSLIGDVGKYSGDEIRQALDRYGIIGGQHTSFNELDDVLQGEIAHAGQNFARRNLNPIDKRNVWLRTGGKVGNQVENTSRLAVFLDQLEKGASMEKAALQVRKYLFDYSELTPFERQIRDKGMPFYTWLRKNIPLQIDNVINQPDKYAVLAKGYDAIEDTTQDRGFALSGDQVPEWMDEYIQLPGKTDAGSAMFVNPNLPPQDLNKLAPDFEKDLLAALNPAVRIPLELGMNRQFFTGSPIYDERLGPMNDYKLAHQAVQGMEKLAPGVVPGAELTDRGVEMPALADYVLRQAPPLTQFGRLASAVTSEDEENLLGADIDLLSLLGLPARAVDEKQARTQTRLRRNDDRSRKRAVAKEQRRLKKSQLKPLYERYLTE